MQIETPPAEKPYEKPEGERRGLVIVNTGDGKGKSTAAFGLALRAFGRTHVHHKLVKISQFMKVPTARFGEHRMFEQLGIPIEGMGDGFSWKCQDLEHSGQLAREGLLKAKAAIQSGDYFMVVLDEFTYPLIWPGEPAARLHPVVWIGNYLNWVTGQLRPESSPAIRIQPPFAQDALHNAWQQIKGMT